MTFAPTDTSTRRAIWNRTGGTCYLCRRALPFHSNWEVEHVTAKAVGGTNQRENLLPACRQCNQRKGGRDLEQHRGQVHTDIDGLFERLETELRCFAAEDAHSAACRDAVEFYRKKWRALGQVRFGREDLLKMGE